MDSWERSTPDATTASSPGGRLRRLLDERKAVLVPGCGDALSARLIEIGGFEAACISGGWVCATRGLPDGGLITLTEMTSAAAYIAQAVSIPLTADADTGFGSEANVRRCVAEFERAGVAGFHIEDQPSAKKCGLAQGKQVIDTGEMVTKISAATDARTDEQFVIIARTDALEVEGLSKTMERAGAYLAAGADMLLVEGLKERADIEAVGQEFGSTHLYFNHAPGDHDAHMTVDELAACGFNFIAYPIHLALAAVTAQKEVLSALAADRDYGALTSVPEFFEVIGDPQKFLSRRAGTDRRGLGADGTKWHTSGGHEVEYKHNEERMMSQ